MCFDRFICLRVKGLGDYIFQKQKKKDNVELTQNPIIFMYEANVNIMLMTGEKNTAGQESGSLGGQRAWKPLRPD